VGVIFVAIRQTVAAAPFVTGQISKNSANFASVVARNPQAGPLDLKRDFQRRD